MRGCKCIQLPGYRLVAYKVGKRGRRSVLILVLDALPECFNSTSGPDTSPYFKLLRDFGCPLYPNSLRRSNTSKSIMKLSILVLFACLGFQVCTSPISGHGITERLRENKRAALQDIVTWDANSLFIYGQRVVIYSGEFHPFRLPVPSLWLDIFQKMRAMG